MSKKRANSPWKYGAGEREYYPPELLKRRRIKGIKRNVNVVMNNVILGLVECPVHEIKQVGHKCWAD